MLVLKQLLYHKVVTLMLKLQIHMDMKMEHKLNTFHQLLDLN